MLNQLRFYHKHDPKGKFIRFAVVTAGPRLPVYGQLRPTIQGLSRRVSWWANEANDKFDIDVLFRGTEFPVYKSLTFPVDATGPCRSRSSLSKRLKYFARAVKLPNASFKPGWHSH